MKKTILLLAFALNSLFVDAQTTQMRNSYCNYTAISFGEFLAADSVVATPNATDYEFRLINTANSYTQTFTNSSGYPYLALYLVTGMTYNTTFTVDVRWSNNNQATWSAYGSTCSITSPITETTNITSTDCGVTYTGWNQLIHCDVRAGVTNYEYQLINSSLSYTQSFVKTNNNVIFSQFTGLANSTTYSMNVRVKLFGTWNSYGPSCPVTTPPAPTTSLQPSYCGFTATDYNQLIYAETSLGSSFDYMLINSALSYTQNFTKSNTNFILSQFTGLANSTTYSVSISAYYNNAWGPYGTICTVTTPSALPTSSLQSTDCNITATSYTNQLLHCESVAGFQCYFYNFTDGTNTYTLEKCNNNNFNLSQLTPTLPLNTTYSVTVKVKINNVYGPFGNICTITTPSIYQRSMPSSYPNPFVDVIEVNMSTTNKIDQNSPGVPVEIKEPIIFKVYDRSGRLIESINVINEKIKFGVNYESGIYNVVMIRNGEVSNFKIIKN